MAKRTSRMVRVCNPKRATKRKSIKRRKPIRRRNSQQGSLPLVVPVTTMEKITAKYLKDEKDQNKPRPSDLLYSALMSVPKVNRSQFKTGQAPMFVATKEGKLVPAVVVGGGGGSKTMTAAEFRAKSAAWMKGPAKAIAKKIRRKAAAKKGAATRARNKKKAAGRQTRSAARRGGTMAKKRGRGRKRIRCVSRAGYTIKTGKAAGTVVKQGCRRTNPGVPDMIRTAVGVGVGAGSGVAISFAADRLNILSASQRNWAVVALGVLGGVAISTKSPMAGASIGGGIAAIGLARALATTLYAVPSTPAAIKGLGYGSGGPTDFDGAYSQFGGGGSVYDNVGAVVDDMGQVFDD